MFENRDQAKDMMELWDAMDAMPEPVACANFPEAFFPNNEMPLHSEEAAWAKSMCQACPVKELCKQFAVKWDMTGIWGGTSPNERSLIRKQQGLVKGVVHPVPGLAD